MIKRYIVFIMVSFLIGGCATIYNPATQRNEFILIDTASEVSLGNAMSKQISGESKISNDPILNARLNRIGQKVAASSDRNDLKYQFFVVENNDLNAFALPGGFVYVHSAVLKEANDDELACVLAHEIGHIAARHSVKRLQVVLGYQIVMSLAFSKSSSVDLYRAIDVVFNVVSLGYSREDERLADRLAVKYAYKSRHNPEAMISFFNKLKAQSSQRGQGYNLVFLSSHTPIDERINNVKKEVSLLAESRQP